MGVSGAFPPLDAVKITSLGSVLRAVVDRHGVR